VGRDAGDVVLGDTNVSGRHGELRFQGGSLTYTDLGSTNGSFLGQGTERIQGPVRLVPGMSLRLGSSTLTVQALDIAAPLGGHVAAPVSPPVAPPPVAPGVRHDYPLAVRDASLGTAIKLMSQTLPYALARFGILVCSSLVAIVWSIVTIVGASALGARVAILGWLWLAVGLGVAGLVWHFALRYVLYLVKCGHVAVLTELVTRGQIACGNKGMFRHGKDVVTERFGQVNALFVLDALIDGVVRAFNRGLDFVTNLVPIPGIQSVSGLIQAVMRASTTYIDETLFSYNLARNDSNVWVSSRDGLVYYAQNARDVLKTGIWVVVLDRVLTVAAWVVLLGPAFVVTWLLPDAVQGVGGLFAFFVAALFASNVRRAFLQPLFLTMVMVRFHVSVQGQPIHEQWDARLTNLSGKFREIKERALAPSAQGAGSLVEAQPA
jgi:hypothetical protein